MKNYLLPPRAAARAHLSALILIACALAGRSAYGQTHASAAPVVKFRVIDLITHFDQPSGMTENYPGLFFSGAGSANPAVLTIATGGLETIVTIFPTGQNLVGTLVTGANNRIYGGLAPEHSVFSVDTALGRKVGPPQKFGPGFTQSLPDGNLLGIGGLATWNLVTSDLNGILTPVYAFPPGETLPNTALYATDGNYYGIFYVQDASGFVFRVTPAGILTTLTRFAPQTFIAPRNVPLLQAADGNLYGVTPNGGANGTGTIYKLTLDGQYTLLYTFPKGQLANPTALIEGSDGNLYGATQGSVGASVLFRVTRTGQFTALYTMGEQDGNCQCQLTLGSDGIIYGTAQSGGTGAGTYFAFDVGMPKPQPRAQDFTPQSGNAGTQVRIWGHDLLSASVTFNGVPATNVSNSGPNYVWATVPDGATTGPLTINTPGGSVTTNANFNVE